MVDLIYKDEVYAIIGAAMEVHRELGCGFLEAVYQEALELELQARKIPFVPQKELPITFKGSILKKTYLVDYVAYEKIIVEIKALDQLTTQEEAQVINYLKASGVEVGVLINFGTESLQWKRIIRTKK
jgi:GxxExxY protein